MSEIVVPPDRFYLGKKYDLENRALLEDRVFYDSKHLTTHAMCVGMTGSGKTGLCLALLEEAALNHIPAICIDPKGDLGNLLLTFPELRPEDFAPWLDPDRLRTDNASSSGGASSETVLPPEVKVAEMWRKGLADWEQGGSRIQQFRDSVDINIFTPGSQIGLPLTVLKSFDAPEAAIQDDPDLLREKISSSVSGLLSLLGLNLDPLSSREHILLSNILDAAWRKGQNLNFTELIRQIQNPPIQRVGVIELETFFPADKRVQLAMQLNNLLASPSFAGWMEGEPLDIQRLLWTPEGKPRLSIISIAHLNDTERMFFVTMFLNDLVGWMRAQSGTSKLRSIFYMDEVFGYFPPISNPPSKAPMLTLLKQARAFGLGVVLATQNPVDLDYKGLANMGTWMLGRLQTQRDKDRVLEGLEGASLQAGSKFNRSAMDQMLSALGNRIFLLNNVHQNDQTIFQTRWALSYLRGPLSRDQIQRLMRNRRTSTPTIPLDGSRDRSASHSTGTANIQAPNVPVSHSRSNQSSPTRPIINADVVERFLVPQRMVSGQSKGVYRPAVFAVTSLHYVHLKSSTDLWKDVAFVVPCEWEVPQPLWESSKQFDPNNLTLNSNPDPGFGFSEMPIEFASSRSYAGWSKELQDYTYRHESLSIYWAPTLKRFAKAGLSEIDARIDLKQVADDLLNSELQKIRLKYASRLSSLDSKIATAQQRLERVEGQAKQSWTKTIGDVAISIFGALADKKKITKTSIGKATSAARSASKAKQQQSEVARAQEQLSEFLEERSRLQQQRDDEEQTIRDSLNVQSFPLEESVVAPRKGDLRIKLLGLVWIPWQVDANGMATPLIDQLK